MGRGLTTFQMLSPAHLPFHAMIDTLKIGYMLFKNSALSAETLRRTKSDMSIYQINIFISHSWNYSGHYHTLCDWIFNTAHRSGQAVFSCRNYSVPKHDPIHNAPGTSQLYEAIRRKIALSHVIVIPTGMYAAYSNWIAKEIKASKAHTKPILAVDYLGQVKTASIVKNAASAETKWHRAGVTSGIWNLYRS